MNFLYRFFNISLWCHTSIYQWRHAYQNQKFCLVFASQNAIPDDVTISGWFAKGPFIRDVSSFFPGFLKPTFPCQKFCYTWLIVDIFDPSHPLHSRRLLVLNWRAKDIKNQNGPHITHFYLLLGSPNLQNLGYSEKPHFRIDTHAANIF